ncbi:ATP-binding cassette domain-containing protein, partial [Oceanivirga salmonicida]|uniref:ATP-binding cassette domain-containing protein n=1 Tax=Oceanivirga salmonicida TaxID=1769291 RepID=UPI0012E350D1
MIKVIVFLFCSTISFVFSNIILEVLGSNAAGKSTFLNLLSGEIIADSGKIELEDADISNIKAHKRAKFISKVHQDPS